MSYRLGVGIVLRNSQGLVFAAQRIDSTIPAWQMPQGGIDANEDPETAAWRELAEETGVKSARIIAQTQDWLTYDLPAEIAGKIWGGKYKGQKQKWFLFDFLGEDGEININQEHPEFSTWAWRPLSLIVAEIVPFKKPIYELVACEFASFFPESGKL